MTSYYREHEAEGAMSVLAEWMGKKRGVKVVYHNGTAVCADIHTGTIKIPKLACASGVTQEALMVLRAQVYHESGHIADTKLAKEDTPKGAHFNILNALEDRRIERDLANEHEGCRIVFNWANDFYNKKIAAQVANGEVDGAPLWEALCAMSFLVQGITPAWRLTPKADAYVKAAYNEFTKVTGTHSTRDCLVIADEIYRILKAKNEELKEEAKQKEEAKKEAQKAAKEAVEKNSKKQKPSKGEDKDEEQGGAESDMDDEADGEESGEESEKKEKKGSKKSKAKKEEAEDAGEEEADGEGSDDAGDEKGDERDSKGGKDDGEEEADKDDAEDSEGGEAGDDEGEEGDESEDGDAEGSEGDEADKDADEKGDKKSGGDEFDESGDSDGSKSEEQGGDEAGEEGSEEGESNGMAADVDSDEAEGSEEGQNEVESKKDIKYQPDATEEIDAGQLEKTLEEEASGTTIQEVLNEKLDELFDAMSDEDKGYLALRDGDEHEVVPVRDSDKQEFVSRRDTVSVAVATMTRALEQALRSLAKCRKNPYLRHGRIDEKRLVQIAKGLSKEVFFRTRKGETLDVAVEIIIDESGSMSNFFEIQLLAIAMGEALEKIGIPFEITGTTTKYSGGDREIQHVQGFTRTNPIVFKHYKLFGDKWQTVRGRIVHTGKYNHNVDGEAVEYAAFRLAARKEGRKVIFSLSDGEPCAGQGNDPIMAHNLVRVCERCRKNGIEVYGVGIGTEAPESFYGAKNFVFLEEAGKMGDEFVKRFSEIVTKGRVHVG